MTEAQLTELARQARNQYKREWYHKNIEHIREYSREYQRDYRKKNADKLKRKNREYWIKKAFEFIGETENTAHGAATP